MLLLSYQVYFLYLEFVLGLFSMNNSFIYLYILDLFSNEETIYLETELKTKIPLSLSLSSPLFSVKDYSNLDNQRLM